MGVHPNYTEVETVKTADGRFVNQNDLKRTPQGDRYT